jgi:subtilisin family serine protease
MPRLRAGLAAWLLLGIAAMLLLALPAQQALGQESVEPESGELVLVGLAPFTPREDLDAALAGQGLSLVHHWPLFDLAAVRPSTSQGMARGDALAQAIQQAEALPIIRFAEADRQIESAALPRVGQATHTPADPRFGDQWALERLQMPAVWSITRGSPDVVVAVLDSGVEAAHEDLGTTRLWQNRAEINGQPGVDDDGNGYVDDFHGWDWVRGDNSLVDPFGHGTHVAGTLAAAMDNELGIAGMAPGVRIMPLRVLNERGNGFISDLISGLHYAQTHGARIVNLSLVLRVDSPALHIAIQSLHAADILVVAATGNYGSRVYWPAAYPETLAVAATDFMDQRALFSNRGEETDVAAPGVSILSTYTGNSYELSDGTSMATPHVAGLAALLWSLRPDLSRDEVVALILETAVDVNRESLPGKDPELGHGRIHPLAALKAAAEGIFLLIALPPNLYLTTGQEMEIPFRAMVRGSGIPAGSAVVNYTVRGPIASSGAGGAAADIYLEDRILTRGEGYTLLNMTLPEQAGQYELLLSVGDQEAVWYFTVQDGPLRFIFTAEEGTLTAGGAGVPLDFRATSTSGRPLTEQLLITLTTNRGHFSDGSQSRTLVVEDGRFSEIFYPGTEAGSAVIRAEGTGQSSQISLVVRPGDAYRLVGPSRFTGTLQGTNGRVPLSLTLEDRYGNRIWSPQRVNFYALNGRFEMSSVESVGGQVRATLLLGSWVRQPVVVWVIIPGSFTIHRAEAILLTERIYLPVVGK